jgi:hypothetical protein
MKHDVPAGAVDGTLHEREFWSIDRHELVGEGAQRLLSASALVALARITRPLGNGVGLGELAGWADHVKRRAPRPGDDADTVAFLQDARNRDNDRWHYVNLPLQASAYSRSLYPQFTRDDDVVQTIVEGVRVLGGRSQRFSELNALRLVVHCVGDVCQPVHVGCSYLDPLATPVRLVFDPAEASRPGMRSDTGGNALLLPLGGRGVSLHAYWDGRLGGAVALPEIDDESLPQAVAAAMAFDEGRHEHDKAMPAASSAERRLALDNLAAEIAGAGSGAAVAGSAEALEDWPVRWATDALFAARDAYHSLSVDRPVSPQGRSYFVRWEGKAAYDARCIPIVRRQMAAAARGLADLLNALWP